jgi:hypothetical protein
VNTVQQEGEEGEWGTTALYTDGKDAKANFSPTVELVTALSTPG